VSWVFHDSIGIKQSFWCETIIVIRIGKKTDCQISVCGIFIETGSKRISRVQVVLVPVLEFTACYHSVQSFVFPSPV